VAPSRRRAERSRSTTTTNDDEVVAVTTYDDGMISAERVWFPACDDRSRFDKLSVTARQAQHEIYNESAVV